jgi:hypothetical protein
MKAHAFAVVSSDMIKIYLAVLELKHTEAEREKERDKDDYPCVCSFRAK